MNKKFFLGLIIIVLLGLIPLTYFREGKMIFGGDHGLWILNPWQQIKSDIFVWNTRGIEAFAPYFPLLVLPLLLLGVLQSLGVPPFISEAILLTLLFIGMGIGAYLLSISIFGKKRTLLNLGVALFYMFNPYSMIQWSIPSYINLASLVQYPLMLALFIRGLSSSRIAKNSFIFAFGSIFLSVGFFMPSYLIISILSFLFYFVFHYFFLAKGPGEKKQALKYVSICFLLFFIFHSWWILTFASLFNEGLSWFKTSSMGLEWTVSNYSKHSSFTDLFQLQGWPGWGTDTFGYDKNYVENFFLIIASFLPIATAVIGLLLLNRTKRIDLTEKKKILFFLAFFLIALFLNKGTHEPYGQVNYWLYHYIPGFAIFRTVFVKLGVILSLSMAVLVGIGIETIKEFSLERRSKWFSFFLIGVLALYSLYNYPFFTGENVLPKRAFSGSSPKHELPPSYLDVAKYLNKKPQQSKVFSLPGQGGWSVFNFSKDDLYIGVDVFAELVNKTFILAHTEGNLLKDAAYHAFEHSDLRGVEKILGMLNVQNLIMHNDVNPKVLGGYPPEDIKIKVDNYSLISKEKDLGQLTLYKIPDDNFYPHLYVPEKKIYLVGDQEKAENFLNLGESNEINALFFDEDNMRSKTNPREIKEIKNTLISSSATDFREIKDKFRKLVIIPFARFTPDHKLYWYIEQKEKKNEKVLKGLTQQLLETKLLYANKRLVELQNLAWEQKFSYYNATLAKYRKKMDEVVALLEKEESRKNYLVEKILRTQAYLEKQNEFLRSRTEDELLPFENKVSTTKELINNQRLQRYLEEKMNNSVFGSPQEPPNAPVIYHLTIPSTGKYNLTLKKLSSDIRFYNLKSAMKAKIIKMGKPGKTALLGKIGEDKNWFIFDGVNLEEGEYILSIDKPEAINLIDGKKWESFEKNSLLRFDKDSFYLEANIRPSAVVNQIKNFAPGDFYKIEFDYQTEKGIAPIFQVWQSTVRNPNREALLRNLSPELLIREMNWKGFIIEKKSDDRKNSFNLAIDSNWHHFETTMQINVLTKSLYFALVVGEKNEQGFVPSAHNFKNFRLEKIFSNSISFQSSNNITQKIPSIEFTKLAPTLYKIKVIGATEPFDLIFSENFHSFWKAYVKSTFSSDKKTTSNQSLSYFSGKVKEDIGEFKIINPELLKIMFESPLPDEKHFIANGYANAWRVEKTGNFEIILEFWPQRLLYLGTTFVLLTVVTFAVVKLKRYA